MRNFVAVLVALLPALVMAGGREGDSIKELISKLGSARFAERQAAFKALQDRPESASSVREALLSADPEVRKRATELLDYFDRQSVRDLNATAKAGSVDRFIELVAGWPPEKNDADVWLAVHGFVKTLTDLHEKKGGGKINLALHGREDPPRPMLSAKRVTEQTKPPEEKGYFLRTDEVDLDCRRRKPGETVQNWFDERPAIAARKSVRVFAFKGCIVFACGPVELIDGGEGLADSIILSGSDVTLDCHLGNSLVIARGKVTCTGLLQGTRIISGKTVSTTRAPKNCIISENDTNPLGFIRWTDAPKDKPAPKAK